MTYIDGALWETETLLDEVGQLANAATVLTENSSGLGGVDDDLSAGWGGTDLETRVTAQETRINERKVEID